MKESKKDFLARIKRDMKSYKRMSASGTIYAAKYVADMDRMLELAGLKDKPENKAEAPSEKKASTKK